MADKPELLYLPQPGDSLAARAGGRKSLIVRGRKEASALLLRKEELPCCAFAKLRGKWGLIGKDGRFVVEPSYGSVQRFQLGRSAFSYSSGAENSLWGYLDAAGEVAIPPRFEQAEVFACGLAKVRYQGKFGFIQRDGAFAIKPQFDSVSWRFRDGTAVVESANKSRFIDGSGKFVGGEFDDLRDAGARVLGARIGSKWGFVNRLGEFVIEPEFDYVRHVDGDGGGWSVSANGMNTLIDEQGQIVISIKEGQFAHYSEGITRVYSGKNSSFFIDKTGNVLFRWDHQKESAHRFYDGVCLVMSFSDGRQVSAGTTENSSLADGAYYIDKTGRRLTDDGFRAIGNFSEGRGIVAHGNRFGYIDSGGKQVTAVKFLEASPFTDGYAQVRVENGAMSWIDLSGASVAEPQFPEDGAARMRIKPFDDPWGRWAPPIPHNDTRFQESLCRVKLSGKWGFVDTRCRVVVKPDFVRAANFSCGMAAVEGGDGKWGYIDKSGRIEIPMQFERAKGFYRVEPEFSDPFSEWEEWSPYRPNQRPAQS